MLNLEEVSVKVVPELGEIAEKTNYSPEVGEADTIFEFIEDLNAKANPKKKVKSKKK